jgi:hypothetical protein
MKQNVGVALIFLMCAVAQAQGPPGGMLKPLTPEQRLQGVRANNWMKSHTYRVQVLQGVQALLDFETMPGTQLKTEQRKKVLHLFAPWRKKPTMTEEQARVLSVGLFKIYTREQLDRLKRHNTSPMPGSGRFLGIRFESSVDPRELLQAKEFNPLNPGTFPSEPLQLTLGAQVEKLFRLLARKN